jgi:cob(I)alamin adenosyltransferase
MVRINKIYTKTGDDGTTGLIGNRRVKKHSLRVCAYGEVDELNAHIGQVLDIGQSVFELSICETLAHIQNELFNIGALLASDPASDTHNPVKVSALEHCEYLTLKLEQAIDSCTEPLPPLKSFVLPGGSSLNSACHIARCVCRRAERTLSALAEQEPVDREILICINRLSDFLFALARHASFLQKVPERLWLPAQ